VAGNNDLQTGRRPKGLHNALTTVAVVSIFIEMEHIEKVSHSWRVERHVGLLGSTTGFFRLSRLRLVNGFRFQFRSMNFTIDAYDWP
jgi:hypothetical protein